MFVIRATVLTFATVKVCNGERRLLPKHKHVNLESGKLRADTRHAAESERAGEPRETHTHTHTYRFTPRESESTGPASERASGRAGVRERESFTLKHYATTTTTMRGPRGWSDVRGAGGMTGRWTDGLCVFSWLARVSFTLPKSGKS